MDNQKLPAPRWRFQFTIARLMACTLFVALAAWTATIDDWTLSMHVSPLGNRNLLPFVVGFLLLAAAIGVLIKGQPGMPGGIRWGCGLLVAAALLVTVASALVALGELVGWLARFLWKYLVLVRLTPDS